jgi:CO/xanthine dehydrogenase Mo-binding subunit
LTDTATRPGARTDAPRIGASAPRPDGIPKVLGEFAFGNDLWADQMLWGATLRSPHPHARVRSIDIAPALRIPGVEAVLAADDVPGSPIYGLEHEDQPVFANDVVRYVGEPMAVVAADHPDTARRAVAAIDVEFDVLDPLVDAEAAFDAAPIHPDGNLFRHVRVRHGDPGAAGEVVVEGEYEVGMQDQAFLGPESGLAIPAEDGGVELYIATQWLHADQRQVAACLGLPPEKVRLVLAGTGGAFGAREDVSLQVHVCLLALHTGRPVKMQYSREESFFGHVHRHPARMRYRHHASRDGRLVKVEARLLFDGGAYASTSSAVIANATYFSCGPYRVPNAVIDGYAVRTNNPPCGAMRGFGAVQACFAHESQMDKLADAVGVSPLEIRLRNALATGDRLITGQVLDGPAPVEELLRRLADAPLPPSAGPDGGPMMARPGGAGRTADGDHVRRGIGWAVSIKNLMFSEGFDDYSTARVVVEDGVVTVHCACAEVGQGFVTLAQQIAREILDLDQVVVPPADTTVGSAGSTSASRQTWMSGGAVAGACRDVAAQMRADPEQGRYEATFVHRHRPTERADENGQGTLHAGFAFAAHRAVADVDPGLGLVRVVEIATTQDVGRLLNPLQALGQVEGGIAQGVGLAVMEEIVLDGGHIRNPSFTDYLLPTALDMPEVNVVALLEYPDPSAPFGAKGIGEPPTISSTAAIAAAIRDATGAPITRVPVRPDDIVFRRD